jgi:hypothetical protein
VLKVRTIDGIEGAITSAAKGLCGALATGNAGRAELLQPDQTYVEKPIALTMPTITALRQVGQFNGLDGSSGPSQPSPSVSCVEEAFSVVGGSSYACGSCLSMVTGPSRTRSESFTKHQIACQNRYITAMFVRSAYPSSVVCLVECTYLVLHYTKLCSSRGPSMY